MLYSETHPRPQLTRERWTDLGGPWGFAHDDDDVGLDQGWVQKSSVFSRTITVPFPPESPASGIHDTAFHPVVWYRRTFSNTPRESGERLLLHFGAVDYRATVWVNGQVVAQHEGGHTPFSADITHALRQGEVEQVIVVRAEDFPDDLTQPRGKQYWEPEPRRIWYHRTTGIWQPVWLEPVASTHVTEVRWTPDVTRGLLGLQVRLNQRPERPLRLGVRLTLRDDSLVDDTYTMESAELRRTVSLDAGGQTHRSAWLLWTPGNPNLIAAELKLIDGETVIDTVYSYTGLRSASYSNGRFQLNGRPQYLRMVLEQGYWPESLLAAPSADALRHEVELIKELGFNGVRIHQKVEDPRFLYWCDRLGVMVWSEMANAYAFSPQAVERFTREWLEVVRRDYSHPSIITWVPFNESWGVPSLESDVMQQSYVKALYHLTHALDNTRPVIGNDGWEHVVGDVWGIHDYSTDGETIRERYGTPEALEWTLRDTQPHYKTLALRERARQGEPVMLTECGGIGYEPAPGRPWFGYGSVRSTEEYLEKYRELIDAILDSPTIAGFCYTQLTDTEQETNGLLTVDRKPKLDAEAVRAINRRASKAIPGDVLAQIQSAGEVTAFQPSGG